MVMSSANLFTWIFACPVKVIFVVASLHRVHAADEGSDFGKNES